MKPWFPPNNNHEKLSELTPPVAYGAWVAAVVTLSTLRIFVVLWEPWPDRKEMGDRKCSIRQEGVVGFAGTVEGMLHLKVSKFQSLKTKQNKTRKQPQTYRLLVVGLWLKRNWDKFREKHHEYQGFNCVLGGVVGAGYFFYIKRTQMEDKIFFRYLKEWPEWNRTQCLRPVFGIQKKRFCLNKFSWDFEWILMSNEFPSPKVFRFILKNL